MNKQEQKARNPQKRASFVGPVSPVPQTCHGKAGGGRKGAAEQKCAPQIQQKELAALERRDRPCAGVQTEGRDREVLTIREGKGKVRNLDVIVGIPVRIINNDCVGRSKVYAQTTGAGREEKAELLSTRS